MDNIECSNCVLENSRKGEKCINCISKRDINNPACESCDFRSSERINYCKQVCGNTARDSKMAPENQRKDSPECERCLYWTSDGSLRDSSCSEICSPFQLGNILTMVIDKTNRMSWLQEKLDLLNGGCALKSTPPPPIIIFLDALNPVQHKNPSVSQSSAAPQFIIIHPQNSQATDQSVFPQMPEFENSFFDISSSLFGGQSSTGMLGESKVIGTPGVDFSISPTVATQTNVLGTKTPPSRPNYLGNTPQIDKTDIHFPAEKQDSVNNDVILGTLIPETRPIGPSNFYTIESSEIPNHLFDLQKPPKMYQESIGRPHIFNNAHGKNKLKYKPGSPNLSIQGFDMNRPTKRPQTLPARLTSFNELVNKPYKPGSVYVASSIDSQYDFQNIENWPQAPIGGPNPFNEQVPTKRPYGTFGRPFPKFEPEIYGNLQPSTDMFLDEQRPIGEGNVPPGIQYVYEPKYFGQPEIIHGVQRPKKPPGGHLTTYKPQFLEQPQNPPGVQMLDIPEIPNPELSKKLLFGEGYKPLQNIDELKNLLGGKIPSSTPNTIYQTQNFDQLQIDKYPLSEFKIPNDEFQIYFIPEKPYQLNTSGGKRSRPHKQNNLSNFGHPNTHFDGKRPNDSPDAFHIPQKFSQSVKEFDGQRPIGNHDIVNDGYGINSATSFPVGSENYKRPLVDDSIWFPGNIPYSKNAYINRPTVIPDEIVVAQSVDQSKGFYGGQNPISWPDSSNRPHSFGESKIKYNGKRPSTFQNGYVSPQKLQTQSILGKKPKVGQTKTVFHKNRGQYGAQVDDSENYETLQKDDHRENVPFMYGGQRLGTPNISVAPQTPKQLGDLEILSSQYRDTSGHPNTVLDEPIDQNAVNDLLRSNYDKNDKQGRFRENNLMHNLTPVSQMQDETPKQAESMIVRQHELEKSQPLPYQEKTISGEENKLLGSSLSTERINNILDSNGRKTFGSKTFYNQTTEVYAPDSSQNSDFEVAHHNEEQRNMPDSSNSDQSISTDSSESMAVSFGKENDVEEDIFDQKESNGRETIDLSTSNTAQENSVNEIQLLERRTDTPDGKEFFENLEPEEEPTDNRNAILDKPHPLQSAQHLGLSGQSDHPDHPDHPDLPDHPDRSVMSWNSHPVRENVWSKPVRYGNTIIYIV